MLWVFILAGKLLKFENKGKFKECFSGRIWKNSFELSNLALLSRKKGVPVEYVSIRQLDRLAENHQGICIYVSAGPKWHWENLKEQTSVLILDRIEDPKNLGAIVRTAWLMGVDGIFISQRRSVPLSPSVMKAASGGAEHIPISVENPKNILQVLKTKGFWIYGLESSSKNSLWQQKYEGKVAFVFGGEHSGLRPGLTKACDKLLSIPQSTAEASYNVSVAVALACAEYRRQNKQI